MSKSIDEMKYCVSIDRVNVAFVDALLEVYPALMADFQKWHYDYSDDTLIEVRNQENNRIVYTGPLAALKVHTAEAP